MRVRTWDAAYIRGEGVLELVDKFMDGPANSVQTLNGVVIG